MYCGFIGGHSLGTASGVIIEGAIVVTVTVKAADEDPFSTTDVGATVQTANAGAPAHPSATVPVKPFNEETCKLQVAVCPSVTVADVVQFPPEGQLAPVAATSEKSVPIPLSGIACGLPWALSLIVSVPFRLPLAVGLKVTFRAQFFPAPTEPTQLSDSEKSLLAATL
jgi:hypothetical protein